MASVETKIVYRLDVSAQEFGLILKALMQNGKKGHTLAATLKEYRDNFRAEIVRQFEMNARQVETDDAEVITP